MKGIYRRFILGCIAFIFVAGLGTCLTATTPEPSELTQNSQNSSGKILEVSVPETANVILSAGGSYTGKLTDFNSDILTVSTNDFSKEIPLADIQQVKFQGDVWISNSDGQVISRRIRGIALTIEGIPLESLGLVNSPNFARLNLENVLGDEEYKRLTNNPEQVYAIKKLIFEPDKIMQVKIVSFRK